MADQFRDLKPSLPNLILFIIVHYLMTEDLTKSKFIRFARNQSRALVGRVNRETHVRQINSRGRLQLQPEQGQKLQPLRWRRYASGHSSDGQQHTLYM
jgi:hypothetical protein